MKRTILAIGLTLLLAMAITVPALAGGWAVITLDEVPGDVEANQPIEIGFMVRQHGVTPLGGESPVIRAHLADSTESVIVEASEEGEVGHYVGTLILPKSGEWEWSIQAFTGTQPMPALTVIEATVAVAESEPVAPTPASNSLPLLAGGIGLLGAVGGLFALQRKVRWAAAFVVIGLLVSGVGFVSAANQPKAEIEAAVAEVQEVSPVSSISQVELGRDLFIAKGCMMCHSHVETNNIREFGIDSGPDLTNLTASPEYLRLWLKDPRAAKSTATMPNLELSDTEMDALIAFINDK
ncbi:MAG: cytochrome c [Anaerolineales bacterium]|nr:cytochrome c [Anaerolineales bacterium]